jgi:hypothetical protein
MTLPASGAMRMGADVDVELGLSATAQISLGQTGVRTIYGKPSGAIRLAADGYGKAKDIVTWSSPASGTVGTVVRGNAYSTTTLSATSPAGSVSYSIVSGSLPSGLTLSGSTISGTVSSGASVTTYSFTVRATGPQGATSDRAFNIVVNGVSGTVCGYCHEGGSITLYAPAGSTFQYLVYANYGTPTECPNPSDNGPSTGGVTDGAYCGTGVHFEYVNIAGATVISFSADNGTWGDPCGGVYKMMAVVAYYA